MRSSAIITIVLLLLAVAGFAVAQTNAGDEPTGDTVRKQSAELDMTTDSTAAAAGSKDVIYDKDGNQLYPMPEERREKLIAYSEFTHIWRFASFFIGLGILALILFTGFSAKLRDWSARIKVPFFSVWAFLILFLVVDFLLNLPFDIYRDYIVESDYGFMNQSFGGWFGEQLMGLAVVAVIGIIPMWFFYFVVNRFKRWWLVFTVGAIPFAALMIVVAPVLISPLFNEFVPIQDKQLEARLLATAADAGITEPDVFQVNASKQSSKINAYVTGLFGTKRIVLYDTMINGFTHDEILFVMGHEMGHYVKNHIFVGLGMAILFIGLALFAASRTIQPVINKFSRRFKFTRLGDIASLPLVLAFLSIFTFVFQPITNATSRAMERSCDKYGIDLTGVDGETAATAFEKLSVFNLSDPDPGALTEFWFYDHPALKKRIAFVKQYGSR